MTIRVVRNRTYYGAARALKVRLDGQEVAQVRNGGEVTIGGNGATQSLRVHMDWMASPAVTVADPGNGVVVVEVSTPSWAAGMVRTFWRPRTAMSAQVVAG